MSKLLVLLLLFWQQNQYVVVKLIGSASLRNKNVVHAVKEGDWIDESDLANIIFVNSSIIRIAGKNGSFVLKSNQKPNLEAHSTAGLISELKNEIIPTKVVGEMKSRAGTIGTLMEAQTYFTSFAKPDMPLLIIDSFLLEVSRHAFSDTTGFFYFTYFYNNEKINKKIPWYNYNHTLQLRFNSSLRNIDGKAIQDQEITDATLYYYNRSDKKAFLISNINMRFQNLDDLKPELKLLIHGMGVKNPRSLNENQVSGIRDYLVAYYGLVDDSTLQQLINNL